MEGIYDKTMFAHKLYGVFFTGFVLLILLLRFINGCTVSEHAQKGNTNLSIMTKSENLTLLNNKDFSR